jgi:hypothetical protein
MKGLDDTENVITKSMEQSPSWEADCRSAPKIDAEIVWLSY